MSQQGLNCVHNSACSIFIFYQQKIKDYINMDIRIPYIYIYNQVNKYKWLMYQSYGWTIRILFEFDFSQK